MIANDPSEYSAPRERHERETSARVATGFLLIWLGFTVGLTALFGWLGLGASLLATGITMAVSAARKGGGA